jgi:hypothetical protein
VINHLTVTNQLNHLGASLSSGIYILKIVRGNDIKFYRLIKQ